MPVLEEKNGTVILPVRVSPGASRDRIQGWHGKGIKVSLAAPPEKNRANLALLEFLASSLGLSRRQLSLATGHRSRDKSVAVTGLSAVEIGQRISGLIE